MTDETPAMTDATPAPKTRKKPNQSGMYVVLISGFAVLVAGMGMDGQAGIAVTAFAIFLFVVAIVLGVIASLKK